MQLSVQKATDRANGCGKGPLEIRLQSFHVPVSVAQVSLQ